MNRRLFLLWAAKVASLVTITGCTGTAGLLGTLAGSGAGKKKPFPQTPDTYPLVLPTGYSDLDTMIQGFRESDLIIVGGRPCMGKTAFALGLALNLAFSPRPLATAFLTLNKYSYPAGELENRIRFALTGIESYRFSRGFLTEEETKRMAQASHVVPPNILHFLDVRGLSMLEVGALLHSVHKLDLVIVDDLQGFVQAGENPQPTLVGVLRWLKEIVRELRVPVVVLSRVERTVDDQYDERPSIGDLRWSGGAFEREADQVLMLFRSDYYDPDASPGMAEIIVTKHPAGITGTVMCPFDVRSGAFALNQQVPHL